MGPQRAEPRADGSVAGRGRPLEPDVHHARADRAWSTASFRAFGVGLWQARLVSEVMGSLAVLLLGLGVARVGGRTAGLIAAGLLATNFVSVMYDRAAIMEATMVSFLVASWFAYGKASESPRWGLVAGAAAMLAYFTKASAVFFLAALGLDAAFAVVRSRGWLGTRSGPREEGAAPAWYTLGGLAGGGRAQPGVLRRAELAGIPVLQLADVGHAQADLHREGDSGPPVVVPGDSRLLHADVDGHGAGGRERPRPDRPLDRRRPGRTPAGAVAGHRLAGTGAPRRRERAASGVPHPGAGRAGGAGPRPRSTPGWTSGSAAPGCPARCWRPRPSSAVCTW